MADWKFRELILLEFYVKEIGSNKGSSQLSYEQSLRTQSSDGTLCFLHMSYFLFFLNYEIQTVFWVIEVISKEN